MVKQLIYLLLAGFFAILGIDILAVFFAFLLYLTLGGEDSEEEEDPGLPDPNKPELVVESGGRR